MRNILQPGTLTETNLLPEFHTMAGAKSWSNAAFRARAMIGQGSLTEAPAWLEAIERFAR